MANELMDGFMADGANGEPTAPRGGLASRALGGLSDFLGSVNKGVETVLSHPLYARAWSGMVSGQTGDPMAGPIALQQLQQSELAQRYQKTQMDREEEAYTTEKQNAMLRAKQIRDMQRAMARNDRTGVQAAFSGLSPEKAGEMFLNPPSPKAPPYRERKLPNGLVQLEALGSDGAWVPDGEPGKPSSLVSISTGQGSLDLNEVANASRAERSTFVEAMKPFEAFDRARTTIQNVSQLADDRGVLPQQASQIIASDVMSALRPEALNEGDVQRLTAVGLWNKALAALGMPPEMTVEQVSVLAKMLEDKAREAEPRKRALIDDGRFRATQFGFDPRLILGDYANQGPPTPVRARQLP